MDWGFVNIEQDNGTTYRAACFAMICHHCGERYIEFFPNARLENLFIGMSQRDRFPDSHFPFNLSNEYICVIR